MILGELGALRSQRETNEEYKNRAREKSLAPKRKGVNRNDELQNSRNIVAGDSGFEPLQTRSQSPPNCHYSNPQYIKRILFLLKKNV